MNKIAVLLFGILCLVLVNARHYEEKNQQEDVEEEQFEAKRYRDHSQEQRHRRRRWQMAYGYDYQPHSYYPDRRNSYDRNEDVIPQIFKLLEDLSDYIKRQQQYQPPPPPQPIYVPYPVPYPVPQYIDCKPKTETNKPNITSLPSRGGFPEMEDTNQNWGFVKNDTLDYEDDGNDGARPITFDPIKPITGGLRPAPKVDHGSSQAEVTTRKSRIPEQSAASASKTPQPGPCNAAILSCCGYTDQLKQRECFANVGCDAIFSTTGCSQDAINRALNSFKLAYSPVN